MKDIKRWPVIRNVRWHHLAWRYERWMLRNKKNWEYLEAIRKGHPMAPDIREKARDIIIKTIPFAQWQSYESLIGAIATALQDERDAATLECAKVANEIANGLVADDESEQDTVDAQKDTAITIRNCILFRAKLKGDAS